jgi:hypothetical protein
MATKSEIQSKLAENESQRNALAAKIGPAQDTAQLAYNAWQSALRLRDQNVSESFTASFNGRTFSGPSAVEDYIAAAQTDFETKRDIRKSLAVEFNALFPIKEQLEKQLETAEDPTTTVKSPETTNKSDTEQETEKKYSDPTRTPDIGNQTFDDGSSIQTFDDGSTLVTDSEGNISSTPASGRISGVPKGAEPPVANPTSAQWAGAKDLRVFLRAPASYLSGPMTAPLTEFGGILFPYTPAVSYDNQASYGSVNPVHSNYTQYFFKNSSVGNITVAGKFTVQNEKEAIVWLSIQHLLRALTKMRFGKDANAGSPPPVCRLEGYGDFMLRNVPVVVSQFKIDYPDNVDYISVNSGVFKTSLVPTISSVSLTLNPSYSRKELQDFSVDAWLSGGLKGKGYL